MEELKEHCALCGTEKRKQEYALVLAISKDEYDGSKTGYGLSRILDYGPVPVGSVTTKGELIERVIMELDKAIL